MGYNKYNSSLEELNFDSLPDEVKDQYIDIVNSVPLIKRHLAPMPRACDLPKDKNGRIIVDVTHPHVLENMDYFRQAALHFKNHGCYTFLKPNPNPNSEFGKWFTEEIHRCLYGMVRESDGEWITGDHYFLLNYMPMLVNQVDEDSGETMRIVGFADVWEAHYYKFHYLNQARIAGKHATELASRSKGKSYCAAAMLSKRFILGESKQVSKKVASYILAFDKAKLTGGDQVLNKFLFCIDHCAQYTQFPYKRLINTLQNMEWKMGYKDLDSGAECGSLNSVLGKSLEDEGKLRGSRGVLYLFEEAGNFSNLLSSWNNLRPSVEEGKKVFGQLFAYGCVCAGTKVWTGDGRNINIENLIKEDHIIGCYDGITTIEPIGTMIPTATKDCVEIVLQNGNTLKCSVDHPILIQKFHSHRYPKSGKRWFEYTYEFERADNLTQKSRVCEARVINCYGKDSLNDARFIGWLIGDGSYGHDCTPTLSSENNEILDYVKSKYNCYVITEHITKKGNIYQELRINGICKYLREIGIYGQTKTAKRLPNCWSSLNVDDICDLLGGLYDTDGYIRLNGEESRIVLTQSNIDILKQIQICLRKLGITSYITKNKPSIKEGRKDKNAWYNLNIGGRINITYFAYNIKLTLKYKQEALDNIMEYFNNNPLKREHISEVDKYIISSVKSIKPIGSQTIYNLSACLSHTYLANNIITHNTAGDSKSDFSSMQELMYHPDGYNIYKVENVYDKEGLGRKWFSLFTPSYLNYAECYDEDGNSDVSKALITILKDRYVTKYNSSDPNTVVRNIAEWAITPQEAILRTNHNIFPVSEINQRIAEIDADPSFYDNVYVGTLVQSGSGEVVFNPTDDDPIRDFPTKTNKVRGALEIYEMPVYVRGKVPYGRYIVSLDNYENDVADSMSLGSTFVLDTITDQIVAEYTGRPDFADDLNEIVRKLCLFYNAKCLYENNKKNSYAYFKRMNCLHLLADTPEWLRQKDIVKTMNYGNSAKGVSATTPVKKVGLDLLRDWLLKPVSIIQRDEDGAEHETIISNLHFVKNRALLREMSLYNPNLNVDRIMAMVQLMLYREEILSTARAVIGDGKAPIDDIVNDPFFTKNDNMFSSDFNNW